MEQIKSGIVNYLMANSFMDNDIHLNDSDSLTQNGIIDSIGLLELIDYICETYSIEIPQNIALEEGQNSISYSCLEKDISDISLPLMDFKHCRFAILAESGIQYLKLLMAVYRSENIAIPLPIEFPKFSLERILDSAHVNNIITTDTQYSRFGENFFERFGTVIVVSSDTSVKILRKESKAETNTPKIRLVLYTSGTVSYTHLRAHETRHDLVCR